MGKEKTGVEHKWKSEKTNKLAKGLYNYSFCGKRLDWRENLLKGSLEIDNAQKWKGLKL